MFYTSVNTPAQTEKCKHLCESQARRLTLGTEDRRESRRVYWSQLLWIIGNVKGSEILRIKSQER